MSWATNYPITWARVVGDLGEDFEARIAGLHGERGRLAKELLADLQRAAATFEHQAHGA